MFLLVTRTTTLESDTIRTLATVAVILVATFALSLSAGSAAAAEADEPTKVTLVPASTDTSTNGTVTYDLMLTNTSGGVGTFDEITVDVTDPSIATIQAAETPIGPATATRTNRSQASFTATFGGDTKDTGTVQLGSVTLAAHNAGTTSINVTVTNNIYREDGTFYTIDEVQDGSLTVTGSPSEIGLTPSSNTILPNSTATFDVVLTNATGGVGTFDNITLTVENASSATIQSAATAIDPATATQMNRSQVVFSATFGANTSNSGTVRLGTMTLAGQTPGESTLNLTLAGSIYTETGTSHNINAIKNASITVAEPPTVLEDTKVNDTDGDGKVDDLNGNNKPDRGDAQTLFANLNEESVTSHPQLFDYNGNGRIDRGDVQALFAKGASS